MKYLILTTGLIIGIAGFTLMLTGVVMSEVFKRDADGYRFGILGVSILLIDVLIAAIGLSVYALINIWS